MFSDLQISAKYSQEETKSKNVVQFGLPIAPFAEEVSPAKFMEFISSKLGQTFMFY